MPELTLETLQERAALLGFNFFDAMRGLGYSCAEEGYDDLTDCWRAEIARRRFAALRERQAEAVEVAHVKA